MGLEFVTRKEFEDVIDVKFKAMYNKIEDGAAINKERNKKIDKDLEVNRAVLIAVMAKLNISPNSVVKVKLWLVTLCKLNHLLYLKV